MDELDVAPRTPKGRWKIACINWTYNDAPHAMSYFLDDERGLIASDYHDTIQDAIRRVEGFVARYRAYREPEVEGVVR